MLDVLATLELNYGISPTRVIIKPIPGVCTYDWFTDEIVICRGNRTSEEAIFTLLHEFRHCMQVRLGMFPEIKTITLDQMPNNETYLELPWEKDANEWALRVGFELGYFPKEWRPRWLTQPELIRGWKNV